MTSTKDTCQELKKIILFREYGERQANMKNYLAILKTDSTKEMRDKLDNEILPKITLSHRQALENLFIEKEHATIENYIKARMYAVKWLQLSKELSKLYAKKKDKGITEQESTDIENILYCMERVELATSGLIPESCFTQETTDKKATVKIPCPILCEVTKEIEVTKGKSTSKKSIKETIEYPQVVRFADFVVGAEMNIEVKDFSIMEFYNALKEFMQLENKGEHNRNNPIFANLDDKLQEIITKQVNSQESELTKKYIYNHSSKQTDNLLYTLVGMVKDSKTKQTCFRFVTPNQLHKRVVYMVFGCMSGNKLDKIVFPEVK